MILILILKYKKTHLKKKVHPMISSNPQDIANWKALTPENNDQGRSSSFHPSLLLLLLLISFQILFLFFIFLTCHLSISYCCWCFSDSFPCFFFFSIVNSCYLLVISTTTQPTQSFLTWSWLSFTKQVCTTCHRLLLTSRALLSTVHCLSGVLCLLTNLPARWLTQAPSQPGGRHTQPRFYFS